MEFRGGPRDGEREVWPYPLPLHSLMVPGRVGFSAAAFPDPAVDFLAHEYRTSDTDYTFDIVTVTGELEAKIGKACALELVRTKARRPIIFTHHG